MAYQTVSMVDFCDANPNFDWKFLEVVGKLPSLSKSGPWIAGGSVRKFIDGVPNEADYDIFFASMDQFVGWTTDLEGRGAVQQPSVAKLNKTYDYEGEKIQCIHFDIQNTLIKTMNRFDMALCQCGYDGTNLYWSDQAGLDIKEKALTFINGDDPVYLLNRAFKFAREGYAPRHGEVARLLRGAVRDPNKIKLEPRKGMST